MTGIPKTAVKIVQDLPSYTATVGTIVKTVVVSTATEGKVCFQNGGVQECLSTCGISMDGATLVGAPVAVGTAVIGALCDFSNGLIYLVQGEKIQFGASMFAVIPVVGMIGRGTGQVVKLTAKEAEEVAAKVVKGGGKAVKEAAEKAASQTGKVANGLILGQDFGKLGKVMENQSGKITGYTQHGNIRFAERGLTQELVEQTIKNPLVRLQQDGGNILYLTREAAVVLSSEGSVVTTYSAKEFMPHVLDVLNRIK